MIHHQGSRLLSLAPAHLMRPRQILGARPSMPDGKKLTKLATLKTELDKVYKSRDELARNGELIKKAAFNYLIQAKKGKYPWDPVARFHLGNGASVYQLNVGADMSEKGIDQSWGTMVNYLYDLEDIEENHEAYATDGEIKFNDNLRSLIIKV